MSDKSILLGFSGGIDSCAAVDILRRDGYSVTALTIDTLGDKEMMLQAQKRAEALGVDWLQYDAREIFNREIIEYFCREYAIGHTPAPCTRCNSQIKWHILSEVADRYNIKHIATGHYFKITEHNGFYYATKGDDPNKDQSYYLWGLSQQTLQRAVTPMGNIIKQDIKSVDNRSESMGVCFLRGCHYGKFLAEHGNPMKEGNVINGCGEVVGKHNGIARYTIGQRRGEGIPDGLRVVDIDAQNNTITVDSSNKLIKTKLYITDCNIVDIDELLTADNIIVKIRGIGRNPKLPVSIEPYNNGYIITIHDGAYAPAKGQPLVMYRDDLVIGGGIVAGYE